jgi:hypothetical protein
MGRWHWVHPTDGATELRGDDADGSAGVLSECPSREDQHDFVDGTKRAFRRTEGENIGLKERNTLAYLERGREVLSNTFA